MSDPWQTNAEMVADFHRIYGHPIGTEPTLLEPELQELRHNLIDEEVKEYKDAVEAGDLVEAVDALADLLYVTYGALVCHGVDPDTVFAEVHRANLSKLGDDGQPIYREDGKVMKGPNYEPPDIAKVIFGEY